MSKMKMAAWAAVVATSLSGCLSSDGGDGLPALPEQVTAAQDMPVTGTATYSGRAGLDVMDNDIGDLDGDMNLTANFDAGTVGGTLSNLESDAGKFDGTVSIVSAAIDQNTFTGELSGEISRFSEEKNDIVGAVFGDDSRIDGEFRGDSADAVAGRFAGQVTHFEGDDIAMPRFEAPVGIKGQFGVVQ